MRRFGCAVGVAYQLACGSAVALMATSAGAQGRGPGLTLNRANNPAAEVRGLVAGFAAALL